MTGDSTVTVWTRVRWRPGPDLGDPEDMWTWIPDLPLGLRFEVIGDIPSELDPTLPIRLAGGRVKRPDEAPQKHQGDPAVRYCRVRIRKEDLPKVRAYLKQRYGRPDLSADVPEEDRLLIDVCAVPGGLLRNPDAVEALFEAKRSEIVNAPLARRQRIKRVLIHAVLRGLPADRAERIRQRLNLPLAAQGAVTRGR